MKPFISQKELRALSYAERYEHIRDWRAHYSWREIVQYGKFNYHSIYNMYMCAKRNINAPREPAIPGYKPERRI